MNPLCEKQSGELRKNKKGDGYYGYKQYVKKIPF